MIVVSFLDSQPAPRYDLTPWTQVRFEEAPAATGPWGQIDLQPLTPPDPDPTAPATRDLTTSLATLEQGFYRLVFLDQAGNESVTDPVQRGQASDVGLYATPEDVRLTLAPDGDTGPSTAASLTDRQLADAIAEAQAEVDSAIRARHNLPLDPVPTLVRTLTRDLAAYLSTLTFRRGNPIAQGDPVALRYDRATRLLTSLATGRIELDTGPDETLIPAGEPTVVNPYQGDLWTLEDLRIGPPAGRRTPGYAPGMGPTEW